MVCTGMIRRLEKKMGRKLTDSEKKYVEKKMHHKELSTPDIPEEEGLVLA